MKNFDSYTLNKIYNSFNPFSRKKFKFSKKENWQLYVKMEWYMTMQLLGLLLVAILGIFAFDLILKLFINYVYSNFFLQKILSTLSIPFAIFLVYYFNRILFIKKYLKVEFSESFYEDIFYQI